MLVDTIKATTMGRLPRHHTVVLDIISHHTNPMQVRRRCMAILHNNHSIPIKADMLSNHMCPSINRNPA